MKVLLGLIIFIWGLYLYFKEIHQDKEGIHKFNAIWKYQSNGFIYALMIGGAIILLRELIIWIF
jgi:hypothetical protein